MQGSGSGGWVSFGQSAWWHGHILDLFTALLTALGIGISRGYSRAGPPLLSGPGARHASMTLTLARGAALASLSRLITACVGSTS